MQLSNAYLITINKLPIWRVKLRVKLSYGLSRRIGLLNQSLSILRLVRKTMSIVQHQDSGVTVISAQDTSINVSAVNLSSAIVDLNHVLRRRSIENVRSADAVVTGNVVRTLSSEI